MHGASNADIKKEEKKLYCAAPSNYSSACKSAVKKLSGGNNIGEMGDGDRHPQTNQSVYGVQRGGVSIIIFGSDCFRYPCTLRADAHGRRRELETLEVLPPSN